MKRQGQEAIELPFLLFRLAFELGRPLIIIVSQALEIIRGVRSADHVLDFRFIGQLGGVANNAYPPDR
jgi:hypothetical protein